MTWEYTIISFLAGAIVGAIAMRFGDRMSRQQHTLQDELEKNQTALEEYRQELICHCARSAKLLDNMATEYRQLHEYMLRNPNNPLPDLPLPDDLFHYHLTKSEVDNSETAADAPPKDYSGKASCFLQKKRRMYD